MFKTKNEKIILTLVLVSYLITILDNSIVFTGTTKMAADLHLSAGSLAWVQTAYAVIYGSLLLLGGRLGDLFGRKGVFLTAMALFGLGSLLVGLSTNAVMIICSRAFQGIGAAILAPTTLAVLMDAFQGPERIAAVSGYGSVAGIGSALGLLVGGAFATLGSWRDGFLMNVPVAILVLILGLAALPHVSRSNNQERKLDLPGTVVSVLSMFLLVYTVNGARYPVVTFLLAVAGLGAFIYIEKKSANPLMPLSLFTSRERVGAYLLRFLYLGGMLGFWFVTPQLMQNVWGWSPLLVGCGFLPLSLVYFVVALQVPRLIRRFGNTQLLIIGVGLTLIGFIWLTLYHVNFGYWLGIGLPMTLLGIGQGLAFSPMTNAAIAGTTGRDNGAASGILNTVHQIGGSLGLSVMVVLGNRQPTAVAAYHVAMVVSACLLGAGFLVTVFILPKKSDSEN
ncbi:MFS transporter [Fructobacillus ficulneus]|uniref:MFS transporter permease n=1 Tax=Fructobacillus ficulneus TaxID=157463 RepID=A0A0K8MKA5_9LACO|nr:MFS transporter [Fructobacillus ficulneus]GAP00325.1 MFS transporter permease [Fructobacillus ficulneus]